MMLLESEFVTLIRPQTGARQKILGVSSNTGKKGFPKTSTLQFFPHGNFAFKGLQ